MSYVAALDAFLNSASDWSQRSYFQSAETRSLMQRVDASWQEDGLVLPTPPNVFAAFELTSFDDTRVVILGQDPYTTDINAHGLSFSVPRTSDFPASLRNIDRELRHDLSLTLPTGDLSFWGKQGVLLLNTVLTVSVKKGSNSHRKIGWQNFTRAVLDDLNNRPTPPMFLLWGQQAQMFAGKDLHHSMTSAHPSPLSARQGFFNSRPFSRINHWLTHTRGEEAIQWGVPVASADVKI
jgi:uracil-DNA glycosylase